MTLIAPFSWDMGITMFSRASDFGDELDDGRGDLDLAELDERHAVLLGLGLHDVVGVGIAQPRECLLERSAVHPHRFLELVGADDPALDQDIGPVSGLFRHEQELRNGRATGGIKTSVHPPAATSGRRGRGQAILVDPT